MPLDKLQTDNHGQLIADLMAENARLKVRPGLDADAYQILAARTLIDEPGFELSIDEVMLLWNAIGLGGEAGEVLEHVKKGVFHRHGIDREKLKKECGDCLWYIAAILTRLGIPMSECMAGNIEKLRERYPEGYSSQRSIDRKSGDD